MSTETTTNPSITILLNAAGCSFQSSGGAADGSTWNLRFLTPSRSVVLLKGTASSWKSAEYQCRETLMRWFAENGLTPSGEAIREAMIADAVIEIDRLTAELEEARTELANERGEGDPPSPGWVRNDFDRGVISWTLYLDADLNPVDTPDGVTERWVLWAILTRATGNIEWNVDECDEGMTVMRGEASSLRSAMRAASAAIRRTT